MKARARAKARRQLVDMEFVIHIDGADPEDRERVALDMRRVLGVCKVGRDWDASSLR